LNDKGGKHVSGCYGKIVLSSLSFWLGIIIVWFNLRLGLCLIVLSVILFIHATLQKRAYHKKMDEIMEQEIHELIDTNKGDIH